MQSQHQWESLENLVQEAEWKKIQNSSETYRKKETINTMAGIKGFIHFTYRRLISF